MHWCASAAGPDRGTSRGACRSRSLCTPDDSQPRADGSAPLRSTSDPEAFRRRFRLDTPIRARPCGLTSSSSPTRPANSPSTRSGSFNASKHKPVARFFNSSGRFLDAVTIVDLFKSHHRLHQTRGITSSVHKTGTRPPTIRAIHVTDTYKPKAVRTFSASLSADKARTQFHHWCAKPVQHRRRLRSRSVTDGLPAPCGWGDRLPQAWHPVG